MIRPFTCICMFLAAGSGMYVYQSKHRVQVLDREIARTLKAADAARDRLGVLRAEWALLNEPDRLQDLAGRFLNVRPMAPTQFVSMADLPHRLPPPGAAIAPPAPLPDTPEETQVPMAAAPPAPAPAAKPAPAPAPAQIAAAQPAPAKPAPERTNAERPAVEKAAYRPAAPAPAPRAPQPMPDTTGLPASAASAIARIARGGAADPSNPAVASALGTTRSWLPTAVAISPARATQINAAPPAHEAP